MARLTTAQRKALPSKDFALPSARKGGKGGYPIPDRSHGANAKARAAQAVKAGRMSKSTERSIDAKVDKKFPGMGKRKSKPLGSEF